MISSLLSGLRERLQKRVQHVNQMTATEVTAAGKLLNDVVERARAYVIESQRVLARFESRGQDGLGELLGAQTAMLREYVAQFSERTAVQHERARQAAAAAKSIADLALSIERLAGEARLLAVNARIESSRLGAHSAGFDVLASEMQRLSDEVAGANERVSELAARLGHDLPWIAQHARDLRSAMEEFAVHASSRFAETERGVAALRADLGGISRSGGLVMAHILRTSHEALSHLQFQDVAAQELRMLDATLRETQLSIAKTLGADARTLAAIPAAEYLTAGAGAEGPAIAPAGEVVML